MLDYYHSNTAAGHSSPSLSSSVSPPNPMATHTHNSGGLHVQRGYETSNSSDDALSMGPNGYYHPQRSSAASASSSSSRSSSPASFRSASDTPSAGRHSGSAHHRDGHEDPRATTPSHRHHHHHHQHQHRQDMTVTPTRATFRTSANPSRDSSPTRSDWNVSSDGSAIQRTPSKRAAANADNRRIAIMDIGTAAGSSSSTEPRTNRHQYSHSATEGGYDESRRGMSDFPSLMLSLRSHFQLPSSLIRRAYICHYIFPTQHQNIPRRRVSTLRLCTSLHVTRTR